MYYQSRNIFPGLASGEYLVTVKDNAGAMLAGNGLVYDKCRPIQGVPGTLPVWRDMEGSVPPQQKGTLPYQFSVDGNSCQTSSTFTGLPAGNYPLPVEDAKIN